MLRHPKRGLLAKSRTHSVSLVSVLSHDDYQGDTTDNNLFTLPSVR